MSPLLVAQNLNVASSAVAGALMGADASWLRDFAFRISTTGVDAIDVCVAGVAPGLDTEIALLEWAAQQVEAVCDLPLFLDSARVEALESCRQQRRRPPVLNSVGVDRWCGGDLDATAGTKWVVQLRSRKGLPTGVEDRIELTERILTGAVQRGVEFDRLLVDPVCLAWGEDFEAGGAVFEYVEEAARRWPRLRVLLAVGNLGHGQPRRGVLEREWMRRLIDRGGRSFLLNAFDPELVAMARGAGVGG